MYDIHCHILPGVDDGAADIEEAIKMAELARAQGIKWIFATPHYIEGIGYKSYSHNQKVLDTLNSQIQSKGIDVKVYLGNEVYITPDILQLLEKGEITTLNGSKYILIEFPMLDIPLFVESLIYNLRLKGITPIIAHPERNTKIMENPNILNNFITKGALAQLNLPSLMGKYGEGVMEAAKILLKHSMIHFVGTDGHGSRGIEHRFEESMDKLSSIISKDYLQRILYTNPQAIIDNKNIDMDELKRYIPKSKIRIFLEKMIRN